MTFPLDPNWRLTADYNEARGSGLHEAWDLAPGDSTRISAPETGSVHLHAILRGWADAKRITTDQRWPDDSWYPFSNYYLDTYGGILLLRGVTYTWLFCHIDVMELGRIAHLRSLSWAGDKLRAPRGDKYEWVRPWLTLADPYVVAEGESLTHMGIEGVDTGLHVHMEVHPQGGRTWHRLDPATVFPEQAP